MSTFEEFQQFRTILCICPKCSKLTRLSDLRLKTKTPTEKTWLDTYEEENKNISEKEQAFNEEEEKLRQIAREQGRKESEEAFNNAICPSLRAMQLDPFDFKPIFHPIDFIVFKGMNQKTISEIILLTREQCMPLKPIREQIKQAVENNKYDWQVARIEETGNITIETK